MEYEERIERRAVELQRRSLETKQAIVTAGRDRRRMRESFEAEMKQLRMELDDLEHECLRTVQRVRTVLARFHTVVKQGDLKRLQQKIDAWGPERFISTRAFQRMLQSSSLNRSQNLP